MKRPILALCLTALATSAAAAPPATGEAPVRIQYLQNAGWLVVTHTHVLLFDYVTDIGGVPALPPDVRPTPAMFPGRTPVVFVSHTHADHFLRSALETWATDPAVQVIVGAPVVYPGARVLQPHERWTGSGLTVSATGSTDEGVGFLVSVDGLTVFHSGDLAVWDADSAEDYATEIGWLKAQPGRIDLAFFPVAAGPACDPRKELQAGVVQAARELKPRVLFPMHVRCLDRLSLYETFRAREQGHVGDTELVAAARRGQWFSYDGAHARPEP